MKKSYLFLVLPALALASCSSDETVNAPDLPEISFTTAVNGSSRAVTTTTATIQNFKVSALSNDLDKEFVYFKEFQVNRNGNEWAGNGRYIWPAAELKFSAYSPADAKVSAAYNRTGLTSILKDFTVEEKAADQIDLLVAQNSMENKQLQNGVSLIFDHALSQIQFSAICSNPVMKIEVYGVKIGYINSKGTFTYPSNDGNNLLYLNSKKATDVWSSLSTPKTLTSELDAPVSIQGADYGLSLTPNKVTGVSIMSEADKSFMIIPQHLKTKGAWTMTDKMDGAYIGVKCKIYLRKSDNDFSTLYWPADGNPAYICTPLAVDFEPSKIYKIILDLKGGGMTDPINPPVKPIIENYINYTVLVNDWTAQGSEIVEMEK